MRRRPEFRLLAIVLGLGLALGVGGGATYAAFSATTSNSGNSLASAADWTAPAVGTSVIAKNTGYSAGFIAQGTVYRIYANVTDSGNPSSGVSTVTANVSNITTGQTAVTLSSGSFSAEGVSYNYRSGTVTANASLSAGSKSYTVTATDGASNTSTQSGLTVTVDNTSPAASDIQTANLGTTAGKAEQGDTVTFTFTEQMDPDSILTGWTGASTNVVVRIGNVAGSDTLTVFDPGNTTQLKLGTVTLSGDYVAADRTFGAAGAASTMVQSGSAITVTLGNASGATKTANTAAAMIWAPSTSATDRAGNACLVTAATESAGNDVEF
jgi:hypothetical protein